jgi:hypothetical protein
MMTKLPFALLLTALKLSSHSSYAQFIIEPDEFAMGNMDGLFDAIIDVRTEDEWLGGHVCKMWCIKYLPHCQQSLTPFFFSRLKMPRLWRILPP